MSEEEDVIWNKEKTLYFKREKTWYRVYSNVLNRRGGLVKNCNDICPNSFISVGVRLYYGSKLKNSKISGDVEIDCGSKVTDCIIEVKKGNSSIVTESKLSNVKITFHNSFSIKKSELEGNILIHNLNGKGYDGNLEIENSKLSGDIVVDTVPPLTILNSNLSGDLIIPRKALNITGCAIVGSVVLEPDEYGNLTDKLWMEEDK